jgi:hypothetical protein
VKCFALFGLLAVLVVTGTASARSGAPNDGTLTVKNADGRVVISGGFKGAVIGRFDKGQVTIKDLNPNDGIGPIVTGADQTQSLTDRTTRYSGSNVRFRMIGGQFLVTVFGANINLSAIGKGLIQLNGTITRGFADDGTYSVNGATHQFPPFPFTFPLDAQATG